MKNQGRYHLSGPCGLWFFLYVCWFFLSLLLHTQNLSSQLLWSTWCKRLLTLIIRFPPSSSPLIKCLETQYSNLHSILIPRRENPIDQWVKCLPQLWFWLWWWGWGMYKINLAAKGPPLVEERVWRKGPWFGRQLKRYLPLGFFINLLDCAESSLLLCRISWVMASSGYSSFGVWASHCGGFSCCGA